MFKEKLFRAAVPVALLLNVTFAGVAGAQDASGGGANPGADTPPVVAGETARQPYVCPPGTVAVPSGGTGTTGGTGTGTSGGGDTGVGGMAPPECAPPPVVAGETARQPYVCPPGTVPAQPTGASAGTTGTGTTGTGTAGTAGDAAMCAPAPAAEVVAGVSERQTVESIQLPRTGGPGPLMLVEVALGGLGLAALGRRLRRR